MKLKQLAYATGLAVALLNGAAFAADSELTTAIKDGDADTVRSLVRGDADVNAAERDGTTPLQWAVYQEDAQIVEYLLNDTGIDVDATNREGITPLALAAGTGNSAVVELLLEAGADVNKTMANGETPLMMAARTGDVATVNLLLEHGAEINAAEPLRGTTALMWAAANRNAGAVQALLAKGADHSLQAKATNEGRNNPYLAPTARERIRDFYHNRGISAEQVTPDELRVSGSEVGRVPREELLSRLPPHLVEGFMEEDARNAQIRTNDDDFFRPQGAGTGQKMRRGGNTALHFAVRENDLASAQALIEAGADVNQVSEYGWTPLLTATQNRIYQLGKYLLEQGADPNVANVGGWNPLYIATDNRNIEGGDYPARKPDMDHLEYIKLLLANGADPNIRMKSSTETRTIFTHQWLEEEGATPFLRAAQSSDVELMKLLLDHGADPNLATDKGVTPLMVAAGIGWVEGVTFEWSEEANKEALAMLIELGNDVNAHDNEDERTALMGAAHKGRNYAVQLLVDAGADLAARDIGSRDSLNKLAGATWQAIDYADGLVRVGVQSSEARPETAKPIRELMLARGLEVPPEGRTLDSICVVDICQ